MDGFARIRPRPRNPRSRARMSFRHPHGLFDHRTGIYWAVDAFATPVTPAIETTADELDTEFWAGGIAMFAHNALSPWLNLVDPKLYSAHVDAIRALGMTTIASAHSPVITDRSIDAAFDLIRALPHVPAPPVPDQIALEAIIGSLTGASTMA